MQQQLPLAPPPKPASLAQQLGRIPRPPTTGWQQRPIQQPWQQQQQPWQQQQQQRWGVATQQQQQHATGLAGTQAAAGSRAAAHAGQGAAADLASSGWQQQQQQQQGQLLMQSTQPLEPQQLQQELTKVQQQLRAQATLAEQLRHQVRHPASQKREGCACACSLWGWYQQTQILGMHSSGLSCVLRSSTACLSVLAGMVILQNMHAGAAIPVSSPHNNVFAARS
jgi:hypothetical protein